MKNLIVFSCVVVVLGFAFAPLRAQYNPPPPPEQGAPPPPDDQGAPPQADQGGPAMDPNAPPSDQYSSPSSDGGPAEGDAGDGGDTNFQTFYDNLSSQGNWVQTENYGYVWQPNVQDPDWAPYTYGHWVYTDEGWFWAADDSEPWGWATYHYGRWVNIDGTGWAWVPGYTWAPAWVSWRYGGGYCGWAPLPPATFVGVDFGGVGFGFHIGGDCDTAFGIGPGWYHFLPVGFIGARNYHGYYANRYNNFTIINNTRNVTNIVVNNQAAGGQFGRVRVGGPSFATVNAQARTPVQRFALARGATAGNARVNGNRLAVFAPRVAGPTGGAAFRPRSVAGAVGAVRVNNGTNINQPPAVNSRLRPSGPSAEQVQAAQVANARATQARVATTATRPTGMLSRPLTEMQPHTEAAQISPRLGPAKVSAENGINHPAATSTLRPENTFTGGEPVRHTEAAATGEMRHATEQSTPVREIVPVVRHEAPQIEQRSPTLQHQAPAFEHQEAPPIVQPPAQHFSQAPAQHFSQAPAQHFSQAPEHHESAPPIMQHEVMHEQAHATGGPGGGHPGGGPPAGGNHPAPAGQKAPGKDDNKKQ